MEVEFDLDIFHVQICFENTENSNSRIILRVYFSLENKELYLIAFYIINSILDIRGTHSVHERNVE